MMLEILALVFILEFGFFLYVLIVLNKTIDELIPKKPDEKDNTCKPYTRITLKEETR